MNFFIIWFFASSIIFGYQIYLFLKNKPVKQKLAETKAKLEIEEVFNNEIKTLLPDNPTDRLARFKELAG